MQQVLAATESGFHACWKALENEFGPGKSWNLLVAKLKKIKNC